MKNSKRKIIIIIAVCIVALLSAAAVYLIMNNELKKMNPLDTGEIIPGIFALRNDYSNIFLIKGTDGYIAIDAGTSESLTENGLNQLGISIDSISAVLLTHSHTDHIGALKVFENAEVYAVKPKLADILISDGDIFEIDGIQIQVISTPGHADDSVCFLLDGKYLFAGDNLSLNDNAVGLFNSIFNKSDAQQMADIQMLSALNMIEYIFTAHYGYTNNALFP